jgi:hypothetical protein
MKFGSKEWWAACPRGSSLSLPGIDFSTDKSESLTIGVVKYLGSRREVTR